jgi:hypothetical protein
MTEMLVFFAFLVFLVYVITQSGVFAPVRIFLASRNRWVGELLYCPLCTAFWCALLLEWHGLYPNMGDHTGTYGTYWNYAEAAVAAVAVLHLTISIFPRFLSGSHAVEKPLVEVLRTTKKK